MDSSVQLALEAQECAAECMERCLYRTSSWLCELVTCVEIDEADLRASLETLKPNRPPARPPLGDDMLSRLSDDRAFMLGKCLFRANEFSRAANVLSTCKTNAVHIFLRQYAIYLDIARESEQSANETTKANSSKRAHGSPSAVLHNSANKMRSVRLRHLMADFEEGAALDGFQLWLYGCVLRDLDQKGKARETMHQAVAASPMLYSAWVDLVGLYDRYEDIREHTLPNHPMRQLFLALAALEHHDTISAIERYSRLHALLPQNTHIKLQLAVSYFNARDMDEAQSLFEEVRQKEPNNLERVDYYSHILYVKKLTAELSHLARDVTKIDKYRPETCMVVGDYYSLRKDHLKAITYFQRALKLNSSFYSAWVLIGHEFMEMKNTQASIEAYRRAIAYNPREVRAWYGLGNAYELLQVHTFALYYYSKACSLRPDDGRMWMAVALVNEQLGHRSDAILAYKRGAQDPENQPDAFVSLAKILIADQRMDEAADTYLTYINMLVEDDYTTDHSFAEACLYLTKFYMLKEDYDKALVFAQRLIGLSGGPEKEEATILLRQINSKLT